LSDAEAASAGAANGAAAHAPVAPAPGQREEFAAGDTLVRFPSADIARLLILSPIAKPGWHGRSEGTATRVLFPGSGVLFEGAYYEVRRIVPTAKDGHRYELWAWEDRFPLREVFDYTREECVRVEAAVRAALRKQAAAHTLAWLMPLVGLLPARLQLAIEEEYGLPAARSTFWSATILLGTCTFMTLAGIQAALSLMMAGPRPGPFSLVALRYLALAFYLVVESIVRYRLSFPAGVVMGSAPVALPLLLVLAIKDALAPRKADSADVPEPEVRGTVAATAVDTVADLPDGRLEIRSLLPKPHWGMRSAIHFRDAWWMLDEKTELPAGEARDSDGETRPWRFLLAPWPEHVLVQEPHEYSLEEVRWLAYDAARERHRPTVEVLGPLFGLLPPELQRPLAEVYGHDARSSTARSLIGVAFCSGFALVVAAGRVLQGASTTADIVIGLAAGILLVETAVRTAAWLRGEISGSVLAVVVRPLAQHLLRLGPPA
jgi:hypothetical protein